MEFDELVAGLKLLLVLGLKPREIIFLLIAKEPGIKFSEIRSRTGFSIAVASHSLTVMKRNVLIKLENGYYLTEVGQLVIPALGSIKKDTAMIKLLNCMNETKLTDIV